MNFKAYNPTWAHHEAMHAAAARWQRRGLLTPVQQQAIEAAYPFDFYRPGLFLRIGLFIFAIIAALGATAFLGLLTSFNPFAFAALLGALGSFAALELLIRNSRMYHAGADNALLYMGLIWTAALLLDVVHNLVPMAYRNLDSLVNSYLPLVLAPMLAVLVVAAIRYADRLVTAAAYATYLLLLTNLLLQVGFGRSILPFALMLASVAAYALEQRLARRPDYAYYKSCLQVLKALTLSSFYLSGNYLIVREGNALISGEFVSSQIPAAPLFYFFTAVIPLAYIAVGLRRPDRVWLLTGLLAAAFSLFTLRHYRSLLPPEVTAVLAGAVLLALAAWAARYLRPARHGLTSLPDDEHAPQFNLESLVVAETAVVPQAPPAGFQFGGGHSGGGGADATY